MLSRVMLFDNSHNLHQIPESLRPTLLSEIYVTWHIRRPCCRRRHSRHRPPPPPHRHHHHHHHHHYNLHQHHHLCHHCCYCCLNIVIIFWNIGSIKQARRKRQLVHPATCTWFVPITACTCLSITTDFHLRRHDTGVDEPGPQVVIQTVPTPLSHQVLAGRGPRAAVHGEGLSVSNFTLPHRHLGYVAREVVTDVDEYQSGGTKEVVVIKS